MGLLSVLQDDGDAHGESVHDMDIMDMNVLDEADIDNNMMAEDDEYYDNELLNTFSNEAHTDDFADSDALKSESEEVNVWIKVVGMTSTVDTHKYEKKID